MNSITGSSNKDPIYADSDNNIYQNKGNSEVEKYKKRMDEIMNDNSLPTFEKEAKLRNLLLELAEYHRLNPNAPELDGVRALITEIYSTVNELGDKKFNVMYLQDEFEKVMNDKSIPTAEKQSRITALLGDINFNEKTLNEFIKNGQTKFESPLNQIKILKEKAEAYLNALEQQGSNEKIKKPFELF